MRRSLVPFALVTMLVVGVACSNESSDTDSSAPKESGTAQFADLERVVPPTPCPSIPGVSDTEIKVGGIIPGTGARAISFGPAELGIKARFDQANANRELGDRTIDYIGKDDASDATRNLEVARELVEQEGVYGIVEVSDQASGSAQYLDEEGVPVTGWHVGLKEWGEYPNMFAFRLPPGDPAVTYTTRNADLGLELGGTKAALVGGGNQSSVDFMNKLDISIEQSDGMETVYKTTDVVAGDTNFTGVVQRIKDSGADTLYTGMDFTQNAALSDQLAQADVEMKAVIFPGGYDSRVLNLPGVEGAIFGLEFKPFELNPPAFEEFDAAMPADAVRNQITYIGWLSAHLFLEGIKAAGVECPTRDAFIANLRLTEDYTANDAFDPVDFISGFGEDFLCAYYVQVEDAAFVPLFEGEEFCGEPLKL
jgi:branched-chain amino acid transport system substrate-binding protein